MSLKEDSGTTTSDMAVATRATKITGKPVKRKQDKDKEDKMSIEEKRYKMYEDQGCIIFEFLHENDYNHYVQGMKRENIRYWRNNPTTSIMLENYQEHRHTGFRVKYQDQFTSPLRRFNDNEYMSGYSKI